MRQPRLPRILLLLLSAITVVRAWGPCLQENHRQARRSPLCQAAKRDVDYHDTSASRSAVEPVMATAPDLDTIAWALPPILATAAFFLYKDTNRIFHDCIASASGHTWDDTAMSSVTKDVLGGPVTLSVSILFGTLVAMTIQTLYDRQINIHKMLIGQIEEVHEIQLLVQGFPEPYKSKGLQLVTSFVSKTMAQFKLRQVTPVTLRQRKEISLLLLLLNDMSNEAPPEKIPSFMGEVYGSVNRFKDIRADLIAAIQTSFSPAHYGNMVVLAGTLLFVFLLETDVGNSELTDNALLNFQLSVCWALLIGTYTMLGVVIYDLLTPWSGIFKTMQDAELEVQDVLEYALVKEEDLVND